MRAALTTVIVLAVFIAGYHREQKAAQAANVQKAGEQAPPKASSSVTNSTPNEKKPSAYQNTKAYLWKATRPEFLAAWVLVFAAGIGLWATFRTLKVIKRQTAATEKDAEAALANAQVMINSERAWILETIGFPNDLPVQPNAGNVIIAVVSFSFRNRGRTPARILAIKLRFHALEAPNTLPESPQYDNGYMELGAYGRMMAADDEPLVTGRLYEGRGGTFQQGDRSAVAENRLSIYAYGVIEYETLGVKRLTQFCYVWYEPRGITTSADVAGFRKGGPPEYNKAT